MSIYFHVRCLRAYFLVDSLLELFVVEDGSNLLNIIIIIIIMNIVILNTVITLPLLLLAQKGVDTSVLDSHTSVLHSHVLSRVTRHVWRDSLGVVLVRVAGELCLSPHPLCLGGVGPGLGLHVHHLLQRPLQHVTPEPLKCKIIALF